MAGQPEEATLVGRDDALDDVARFVEAVASAPAALLLEGEAGIGKTTLWRSARVAAADRGHRVLQATAVEGEADLPFVGLRDLLDDVAPDVTAELPPPQRVALDAALLRSADPGAVAEQHAVCVAVLGVVRALAAERPVVIAVDDVGWLDRSSDRVLRYVVRRLRTERVGVVATRRPAGTAPPLGLDGPPLDGRLHHVTLGPLDRDAVHDLLTRRYGLALPRRLTRRIHAACGGNPFAAVELGRLLSARGDRVLDEDALPLPGGAVRVAAARIAALGPAARRVLAVVAVASGATPGLLTAALGDAVLDGLDEAVAEGLLVLDDAGTVFFAHPLLRSATAATLTVGDRRGLHTRLADLVTDPDERAVHLGAAAAGPDEAVAAAVERAAVRSFCRGAPDVAAVLAGRAVALTPPGSDEALARRRLRVGEYRYRAEDMDAAHAELSTLVAEQPPGQQRAEALLWLACVRQAQNGMGDAVGLSRAALGEAVDDALRAAAGRHLALACVIAGDPAAAYAHAADALVRARSTGDPASVAESEAAVAWTRFWSGRGLDDDLLGRARASRTFSTYAPQESSPHIVAGLLLSWADRVAEAREVLHAEDRRLIELGQDRPRALVLFTLAELECRAGDLAAAQRSVDDALRTAGLVGDDFYRSLLLYASGLVAAHHGRLDEARARAGEAITLATTIGSAVTVGFACALLGFVALSADDPAAAHQHLAPLSARLPPDGSFDPGLARFVPDHVEALVALGSVDEATRVLAPFADQARALDRPWAQGAALRCRALLAAAAGELEEAGETVDAAVAAHDGVALPVERARTLLVAGSVKRRLRRRREARAALDEALAEFTRLGATAWADRARAERRRIGGRVGSPQELTDAEQRIAERVAAGLSNKEVAAALFLSVGTVEAALWKIYRKLDVRSRTQLAARLAERER